MNGRPYYISLTIPYVNSVPHIGYALEAIQGDTIARYQRLLGKDVFFVYGTDENSLKNVQAAQKVGEDTMKFVTAHAEHFEALKNALNLTNTDFIRTTEERHFKGAQKLWEMCDPDDIYKKSYTGLYCVGCEAFYSESDLIEGNCPTHGVAPDVVEEENYFFRLSKYQEQIKQLLEDDVVQVHPASKKNEMLAFIERGLEDFSISRSHERAHGWGVPVPGDESQIMYVWFDALSNYINALDFADDGELFKKYWLQEGQETREVVHVLGKDVVRFHLIYWIGMLLSADLPLPTDQFVHGFLTSEGKKMSKSLGNVLNPVDVLEKYGVEPVRYFFLAGISAFQDGDFSDERFREMYTADLVNGIGNLTSRILAMVEKYNDGVVPDVAEDMFDTAGFWKKYHECMQEFAFHDAMFNIKTLVSACDHTISEQKPWEKAQQGEDIGPLLYQLVEGLRHIALSLMPALPQTGEEILKRLNIVLKDLESLDEEMQWGRLKPGTKVEKGNGLFERLKK